VSTSGQRSSIRSITIGWSIPASGSSAVLWWSSMMVRRWNAESSLMSSASIGLGVETRLWMRVRETKCTGRGSGSRPRSAASRVTQQPIRE
jgi:hypothetical protein